MPSGHAAHLHRGGVRWDRIGRVVLLLVLGLVLLLYVGPAHSYLQTWRDAKSKRAEVRSLEAVHARLAARRRALHDPRVLELEARKFGMVRPGERAWAIDGLPR